MSLRYLFLNSSYRKAFNFTWESLSSAQTALLRLWKKYAELGKPLGLPLTSEMQAFNDAICTDLNTSKAISILWDVLYSGKPADKIAATLLAMDQILGLDINNSFKHIEEIKSNNNLLTDKLSIARELFMKRTTLRKCNNYVEADAVKKELLKLGFQVEDTKDGSYLMFKGLLL
jgi:cysteinyl-tRNA synthetase